MHVTDRIKGIDWFSHVGHSTPIKCDVDLIRLSSWPEAVAECQSIESQNMRIEARNATIAFLSHNHKQEYRKWNLYTSEAKLLLAPEFERLDTYVSANDLETAVADFARWDVLSAVLQEQFWRLDVPRYFLELFPIYEAGHFPAGWRGQWPNGSLVVY